MRRVVLHTAWLLVLGCTSAPSEPDRNEKPEVRPVDGKLAAWERIEKEAMQRYSVADQQRIAESGQHYKLALGFYKTGDFDRANDSCQTALQKWPYNMEARKLLSEIHGILNGTATDEPLRHAKLRLEQTRLEIVNHIRNGDRYHNAKMYKEAIKEFQYAEWKILGEPTLRELLPDVRESLSRAKDAGK